MRRQLSSSPIRSVGFRRSIAAFTVFVGGVIGFTGATASAEEYSPSDRELLEAVTFQTGPAAKAAGTSVASVVSATEYKRLREASAAVVAELEASDDVLTALDGLRSGDPIVVDRSITTIIDEAAAVMDRRRADGTIDQALEENSANSGYAAYRLGRVLPAAIAVIKTRWLGLILWKTRWFFSSEGGESQGLLRDEAVANMTAAWAD